MLVAASMAGKPCLTCVACAACRVPGCGCMQIKIVLDFGREGAH